MKDQVKVPKEIQELFIEAEACKLLAEAHTNWFVPSPKALYYTIRKIKVASLAWKTLDRVYPQVATGAWTYDSKTGIVSKPDEPVLAAVKKPRAPRKPKVTSSEGAAV